MMDFLKNTKNRFHIHVNIGSFYCIVWLTTIIVIDWSMIIHPWIHLNWDTSTGWVTSMLTTDVADEMCWWQLWDVDDGFGYFGNQYLVSFNISTNIEKMSPTCENRHQLWVIKITMSPTSLSPLNYRLIFQLENSM